MVSAYIDSRSQMQTWGGPMSIATAIAIEKMNETLLSFYFKTLEMHA